VSRVGVLRFAATVATDIRLQHRNGFYYAVAFVLAVFAIVITALPVFDWSLWLPALLFGNLVMVSFFFIGGLILLEKTEGTLEAQVVTPLRLREYLGSKLLTLVALSLAENLIVVLLVLKAGMPDDSGYRALPLAPILLLGLGIATAAVLYTLFGFMTVARYDSINEFLLPATFIVTALSLPYLGYFDFWTSPLLYLHPLQGSLVTMKAAFFPVPQPALWAGAVSTLAWIAIAYGLSRRAFRRFVIQKEGAH